jgi:hypothetical protein
VLAVIVLFSPCTHSEAAAKSLIPLGRFSDVFSDCALILLDYRADFDSAIRRFESSRPSHGQRTEFFTETALFSRGLLNAFGNGVRARKSAFWSIFPNAR